jgi:hypothetical protein
MVVSELLDRARSADRAASWAHAGRRTASEVAHRRTAAAYRGQACKLAACQVAGVVLGCTIIYGVLYLVTLAF